MSKSRAQSVASASCVSRTSSPLTRRWVEDRQPRVLERDQAHQHVAMLALAADLVSVGAGGLVAVVAVGDQQLGVARAPPARRAIASGSATRQRRLTRAVVVGGLAEGRVAGRWLQRRPAAPSGRRRARRSETGWRRVARVRRRRSSLGPGCVRSCGRTRPGPYSSMRTRAKKPRRVGARRRGQCIPGVCAQSAGSASRTTRPRAASASNSRRRPRRGRRSPASGGRPRRR